MGQHFMFMDYQFAQNVPKGIIQVGIKKVVIEKCKELDNWNESVMLSQEMFNEAGVELIIKGNN